MRQSKRSFDETIMYIGILGTLCNVYHFLKCAMQVPLKENKLFSVESIPFIIY